MIKRFLIGVVLTGLFALPAGAVEVKMTVTETAGVARTSGPVTSGVPFAKGAVTDAAKLSVRSGGKVLPAQFIAISKWPDGSVRWALMDTQVDVPAGGKAELVVRDDGANAAPSAPVKVADAGGKLTVSNGPLAIAVDRKGSNLFDSITVDGKKLLTAAGRGLVLYTTDGKEVVAGSPETVEIEQAGPMRAIVKLAGKYPGLHNGKLTYTVRLTVYAGHKFVTARVWLGNRGAHGYTSYEGKYHPEWFGFDGMAVELAPALGDGNKLSAECEGVASDTGTLIVRQFCQPRQYRYEDLAYTIRSGDAPAAPADDKKKDAKAEKPAEDPGLLKAGDRTDGLVTLTGPDGKLSAGVRDFWQNYDKTIELRDGAMKLWLWPRDSIWPRRSAKATHYSYVGDQLDPMRVKDGYSYLGAIRKGHELILDFSGAGGASAGAALSAPLHAAGDPVYVAETRAAPGIIAPASARSGDGDLDWKLASWNRMAASVVDPKNPNSILSARTGASSDLAYWFGWMDHGDVQVPQGIGPGPVSLQFDWPWIVLVNYVRFGDPAFLALGEQMVRHGTEIDQLWSGQSELEPYRDLSRDDRGYREYHTARFTRGGPNLASNWIAGRVLHYMLTGDPFVLEAIEVNYRGMHAAVERARAEEGGRLSVTASNWTVFNLIALYDLTGEKKYIDEALTIYRRCIIPVWKSVGPFLHNAEGQIRGQGYAKEDMAYCYSIATWCVLHDRTGDEKLTEMLKASCEKEWPESFYDAPLFLADLYAYMAEKTGDEDLLEKSLESWLSGFPESKCPPVFKKNDSKWCERSAMTLRAGHLLQHAWWKAKKK